MQACRLQRHCHLSGDRGAGTEILAIECHVAKRLILEQERQKCQVQDLVRRIKPGGREFPCGKTMKRRFRIMVGHHAERDGIRSIGLEERDAGVTDAHAGQIPVQYVDDTLLIERRAQATRQDAQLVGPDLLSGLMAPVASLCAFADRNTGHVQQVFRKAAPGCLLPFQRR